MLRAGSGRRLLLLSGAGARLAAIRLQLLFTPGLVPAGRDPLDVLAAALPFVDLVQVRIKDPAHPAGASPARELLEWTRRVLARARDEGRPDLPVLVNDRVDVALALADEGVRGVHLGQDDLDPVRARALLGEEAWIGLSTHDARQLLAAEDLPVDYVGFGPVFATATKGYARGLGPEAAWVAAASTPLPLFPIGGIDATSAGELARVGRAAVSAAVLRAEDPAAAARELRAALSEADA